MLLNVLHKIIQEFPYCYIVLDALDESQNRNDIIDVLQDVINWKLENLHVLVTSRRERDIESSLQLLINDQQIVCLQSSLVDEDIRTYVSQRLISDKSLQKWNTNPEIRKEIKEILIYGAHGMCVH